MPDVELERLRKMLVDGDASPASFYGVQLTQLSTKGVIHNMPPIAQYKDIRNPVIGLRHQVKKIFRFYFDGLIAHFHLPETDSPTSDYGPMVLGAEEDLVVSTVTYERSFQKENLQFVLSEALPSKLL
ncbi:hypothetical protein [Variovorax sp. YR750]|uniref:hypothetical protein n=1 Tax=Variovorax sp. YR750 TaxID=1884384 RepID=UPI0011607008|nr:hypothetical protein [Variovorax sp. YR750]